VKGVTAGSQSVLFPCWLQGDFGHVNADTCCDIANDPFARASGCSVCDAVFNVIVVLDVRAAFVQMHSAVWHAQAVNMRCVGWAFHDVVEHPFFKRFQCDARCRLHGRFVRVDFVCARPRVGVAITAAGRAQIRESEVHSNFA
jgi:hypothetical protein